MSEGEDPPKRVHSTESTIAQDNVPEDQRSQSITGADEGSDLVAVNNPDEIGSVEFGDTLIDQDVYAQENLSELPPELTDASENLPADLQDNPVPTANEAETIEGPVNDAEPVGIENEAPAYDVEPEPVSIEVPADVEPIGVDFPADVEPMGVEVPAEIETVGVEAPADIEPVDMEVPVNDVEPMGMEAPASYGEPTDIIPAEVEPMSIETPAEDAIIPVGIEAPTDRPEPMGAEAPTEDVETMNMDMEAQPGDTEQVEGMETQLSDPMYDNQEVEINPNMRTTEDDEFRQLEFSSEPTSIQEGVPRKSKTDSVKFAEPLNKLDDLESRYAELMGEKVEPPAGLITQEELSEIPSELIGESEDIPEEQYETPAAEAAPFEKIVEEVVDTTHDIVSHEVNKLADRLKTLANKANAQNIHADIPIGEMILESLPEIPEVEISEDHAPLLQSLFDVSHQPNAESIPDEFAEMPSTQNPLMHEDHHHHDAFGAFEITPDDIFNEIKVARTNNMDQEHTQNLHSFTISKSFSSENVVVLLNLRRMKDGEWVLDKTIAQGLKPQTYGGVVSIDKYDFIDQPSDHSMAPLEHVPRTSTKIIPSQKSEASETAPVESDEANGKNRNVMDILRKLENYVADVNREIQAAREALKNSSTCVGSSVSTDSCNDNLCEPPQFNELPFIGKLIKMFNVLMADEDEPCFIESQSREEPAKSLQPVPEPELEPLDEPNITPSNPPSTHSIKSVRESQSE